jgi:hypothetical protein
MDSSRIQQGLFLEDVRSNISEGHKKDSSEQRMRTDVGKASALTGCQGARDHQTGRSRLHNRFGLERRKIEKPNIAKGMDPIND